MTGLVRRRARQEIACAGEAIAIAPAEGARPPRVIALSSPGHAFPPEEAALAAGETALPAEGSAQASDVRACPGEAVSLGTKETALPIEAGALPPRVIAMASTGQALPLEGVALAAEEIALAASADAVACVESASARQRVHRGTQASLVALHGAAHWLKGPPSTLHAAQHCSFDCPLAARARGVHIDEQRSKHASWQREKSWEQSVRQAAARSSVTIPGALETGGGDASGALRGGIADTSGFASDSSP